jgi:hypothetical protein
MISRQCKGLAVVDFAIAADLRHAAQEAAVGYEKHAMADPDRFSYIITGVQDCWVGLAFGTGPVIGLENGAGQGGRTT